VVEDRVGRPSKIIDDLKFKTLQRNAKSIYRCIVAGISVLGGFW
jgi:hypothetical protein